MLLWLELLEPLQNICHIAQSVVFLHPVLYYIGHIIKCTHDIAALHPDSDIDARSER